EFLFTVDLVNNYLNRSIFIFTAFGLMCWYLFVIDIFEGGLHWPFESATLPRKTFIKNWIMSIVLFGMVVIFMIFLTKSIWTKLNIVEMMLQTIPVLIITIFDMVSLLYKPFKMVKKVETKRERIGLLGLFLSGIILLAFLVTYIVHNLSNQALDPIAAYHARGIFYYLSMIMIPVYCIFNYIGLIYPVKEK
nr:hypothetical protein [Candidatus Sigynarchaeota archaeon]